MTRALAAQAAVCVLVGVASVGALISPVTGAAVMLTIVLLGLVFRERFGARGSFALACGVGFGSAVPAIGALVSLPDAVVFSHWRCGTGAAMLLLFLPVFAGAVTMFSTGVGWLLWPLSRWISRVSGWVALAACAALLSVTIHVASQGAGRPAPEHWVDTLRPVTELPAETGVCAPPLDAKPEDKSCSFPAHQAEGLSITRVCRMEEGEGGVKPRYCRLEISDLDSSGHRYPDDMRSVEDADEAITLLRRSDSPFLVFSRNGGRPLGAVDLRNGQVTDVTLRDVAHQVNVASAFLPGLLLAALVALLSAGAAMTARQRRARLSAFREGQLLGDGVIELEDGTSVRVPDCALSPGAVHVRGAVSGPETYRDQPELALDVRAGSKAAAEEHQRTFEVALSYAAISAFWIGASPALLAMMRGLID